MKAKINKEGSLIIETESEIEQFAIESWRENNGIKEDDEFLIIVNDYNKIKCIDYEKKCRDLEDLISKIKQEDKYNKPYALREF